MKKMEKSMEKMTGVKINNSINVKLFYLVKYIIFDKI